ncbi:MAG: hypothetical protein HY903_11230 [Deltaproteobacteria bacterium]|nr:hypothetical protein [Deltaproteobacteria bacterium]
MSLRTQILVLLVVLVAAGVALTGGTLVTWFRTDLNNEIEATARTLREELVAKGTAVALNAALASEAAIEGTDFVFLTEILSSTVTNDPEIAYAFIANKTGRIAVHSDPAKAGSNAEGGLQKEALAKNKTISGAAQINGQPGLEVAAPVNVGGFPWGTLHLGIQLKALNQAIETATVATRARVVRGTTAVGIAALVVLVAVLVVGVFLSKRTTRPLGVLLAGIAKIRAGSLEHVVRLGGSREFVALGMAVNELSNELRVRTKKVQQNVTKLHEALSGLKTATRQREEFLANVSHELRTPLNAILAVPHHLVEDFQQGPVLHCKKCDNYFQTDRAEASGTQLCPDCKVPVATEIRLLFVGNANDHVHFIQRLKTSTATMRTIVRSLVDFSRLGGQGAQLQRKKVDVRTLIDTVRGAIVDLAKPADIRTYFPKLVLPLVLDVDDTMLSQILLNLLGNAVKFTPAGGAVSFEVEPKVDQGRKVVEFRVTDTGVGLEKNQLEAVFKDFYQVDSGHTRAKGGTGLGLSIAKRMVELHGGRIWADSAGLNQGTTFAFRLPAEAGGSTASGS